jgi:hypothetical protein
MVRAGRNPNLEQDAVYGIVMPALVAGIHVLNSRQDKDVDGRNKVRP